MLVQVYDEKAETYRLCKLVGKILKFIKTGRIPFRNVPFHKPKENDGTRPIPKPKKPKVGKGRNPSIRKNENPKVPGGKVAGDPGAPKKGGKHAAPKVKKESDTPAVPTE
jgi:hypothetical protein